MKKLLSLCIPTYNRKKKLRQLMENIRKEIKGFETKIEICVSDNGSVDGTKKYLEKIKKDAKFEITNYFEEKNMGFDKNLLRALQMGKGKWLWMMGDDDKIEKKSFEKICKLLEKTTDKNVAVIYIETTEREKRGNTIQKCVSYGAEDLVKHPLGFISTIIIKREYLDKIRKKTLLAGNGTLYMHKWILRIIGLYNPECKVLKCGLKVVIAGEGDDGDNEPDQFEYSKNSVRLSQELRYSRASFKQYSEFFLQNIGTDELYKKYLLFMIKKLIGSIFLPFLEISLEREFRSKEAREKINLNFFNRVFGLYGIIPYLYLICVRNIPKTINSILLWVFFNIGKILKITKENDYEYWGDYWRTEEKKH